SRLAVRPTGWMVPVASTRSRSARSIIFAKGYHHAPPGTSFAPHARPGRRPASSRGGWLAGRLRGSGSSARLLRVGLHLTRARHVRGGDLLEDELDGEPVEALAWDARVGLVPAAARPATEGGPQIGAVAVPQFHEVVEPSGPGERGEDVGRSRA